MFRDERREEDIRRFVAGSFHLVDSCRAIMQLVPVSLIGEGSWLCLPMLYLLFGALSSDSRPLASSAGYTTLLLTRSAS